MPDATVADASTGGLIIELVATGGVPQIPEQGVEITLAVLGVQTIRAIGDAAPGDVRTTRTNLKDHEWSENTVPIPQLFPLAPPGVYSTIELRVADSSVSSAAIIIGGRVTRGGNVVPFEIQSTSTDVAIEVNVNTVLAPRQLATTTVAVDFGKVIGDIDWATVPLTTDGRLFIGDGDADMASVVANLKIAFAQRAN